MNYELFKHENKQIYLIDMTREPEYYFSEMFLGGIQKYVKQEKSILILTNKQGYNAGIICQSCGHISQCRNCSVSISYHQYQQSTIGLCHICKTQYPVPSKCRKCSSKDLFAYGLGMQQLSKRFKDTHNITPLEITAKKINSFTKIQKIKKDLFTHQVIIASSILSEPIKGREFDLVVFLQADQGLQIPSFNASEKVFWNLYETFQKHQTTTFLVQSYDTTNYAIRKACALDLPGFEQADAFFREQNNYPPFVEMCLFLYKDETELRLYNKIDAVKKELLFYVQNYQREDIEIYTTPPLVYKMFGKYRYHIILKGKDLRAFVDIIISKLKLLQRGFKVDRMPKGLG